MDIYALEKQKKKLFVDTYHYESECGIFLVEGNLPLIVRDGSIYSLLLDFGKWNSFFFMIFKNKIYTL